MAEYEVGLRDLPDYMRDGVIEYIEHGRVPGDFLMGVFENNFTEAVARADMINSSLLVVWAAFLHTYAPSGCWGSREKVRAWVERRGLQGPDKTGKRKVHNGDAD